MEVWRVLLSICKHHVIDVLIIANRRCGIDIPILYTGDIEHIPDELLELRVEAYWNERAGAYTLYVSVK